MHLWEILMWCVWTKYALVRSLLCSTCLVCNEHLIALVRTINPHGSKKDTCHIVTFYSFKTCRCTSFPTHMGKFFSHNYVAIIHYVVRYIVTYIVHTYHQILIQYHLFFYSSCWFVRRLIHHHLFFLSCCFFVSLKLKSLPRTF